MAGWGASTFGTQAVIRRLRNLTVELDGNAVFVVGPSAKYGVFQEMGTSRMEPNPFLAPAVADYRRNPQKALSGPTDSPVNNVALYIEERSKHYATTNVEPGPDVRTGNLRGSITTRRIR